MDWGATEKNSQLRSLSANQAGEPQVIADLSELNLDKLGLGPPDLKTKGVGARRALLQSVS
jgi:hypothetical protein